MWRIKLKNDYSKNSPAQQTAAVAKTNASVTKQQIADQQDILRNFFLNSASSFLWSSLDENVC